MVTKLKIIILGDSGVGKSTFIESYITDYNIKTKIENTLICDLKTYNVIYGDNEHIQLLFCDFSGIHQSRASNKSYFHNADGIILMFDLTNNKSMLNIQSWLTYCSECLNAYNQDQIPFIIIGNKLDLIMNQDEMNPIIKFFNTIYQEYTVCSSIKKNNISTSLASMDILIEKIKSFKYHKSIKLDKEQNGDTNSCACTSQ